MSFQIRDRSFATLSDGAPRPVLAATAKVRPDPAPAVTRRRRPWWTPLGWLLVLAIYALAFVLRRLAAARKRPDWLDDD
jgi:hypothetical protein